jgi:hypothetical protein
MYLDIDARVGIKQVIGLPTDQRLRGSKAKIKQIQIMYNFSGILEVSHLRIGKWAILEYWGMINLPHMVLQSWILQEEFGANYSFRGRDDGISNCPSPRTPRI